MRISDWSSDVCSSDLRASAEGNAAQLEHMSVQRTVTAIADADLSNATLRLEAWKSADLSAQSAGDALARTERGYQLGQIDLADLLYARRQANAARRSEIMARSEARSEEHTSELQSLMRTSYAVFS